MMVKLLLRLLNKVGVLKYLNLTFVFTINNQQFKLPVWGHTGYDLFFEKEGWMTHLVKKLLTIKPESAFVDVGVNLGQTLLTVKSIKANIPYYGFEPNPVCVSFLTTLIKINKLSAEIFPVALSDHNGFAILFKEKNLAEDSSATIVSDFRETTDKDKVYVPVFSSEMLAFSQQERLGIVKIDVEGGELEVIKCLYAEIKSNRPFIICEILPVYDIKNQFRLKRQEELVNMLLSINYVIYRIHANNTLERLRKIDVHGNVRDSNYLFVPVEFESHFSNSL